MLKICWEILYHICVRVLGVIFYFSRQRHFFRERFIAERGVHWVDRSIVFHMPVVAQRGSTLLASFHSLYSFHSISRINLFPSLIADVRFQSTARWLLLIIRRIGSGRGEKTIMLPKADAMNDHNNLHRSSSSSSSSSSDDVSIALMEELEVKDDDDDDDDDEASSLGTSYNYEDEDDNDDDEDKNLNGSGHRRGRRRRQGQDGDQHENNNNNNKDQQDESDDIARTETRAMRWLKGSVLITFFLAMMAVAISVYFYTSQQQDAAFRADYRVLAQQVLHHDLPDRLWQTLDEIDALTVGMVTMANVTNQTWPS
jgi:hypothetical protein